MKPVKRTERLQQEQADFASLLQHRQGKRFIRRLLQMTGVWSASYAHKDALACAYNEGRRSVGLYVLQQVQLYAPHKLEEVLGWTERAQSVDEEVREEKGDE